MRFSNTLALIYIFGIILSMFFSLNDPYYINRLFAIGLNIFLLTILIRAIRKKQEKMLLKTLLFISLTQLFAIKLGNLAFVNVLSFGFINYLHFDNKVQIQTLITSSSSRIFSTLNDGTLYFGINFISLVIVFLIIVNLKKTTQHHEAL